MPRFFLLQGFHNAISATFSWIFSRYALSLLSGFRLNVTSFKKSSQIYQSKSLSSICDIVSHHISIESFEIVLFWIYHIPSSFCFSADNLLKCVIIQSFSMIIYLSLLLDCKPQEGREHAETLIQYLEHRISLTNI